MKKIFLATLFLIISISPSYAVGGNLLQARPTINTTAREGKIASREAKITQIQANISQDLQNRAKTEIARRVEFLTQLITQINAANKLSATEKSSLQSQIQTQIDGLNALQVKISADTDNTTLRADVKSIVSDYYIFLFFREQVNMLVTADKVVTATNLLSSISAKLQTRINQAKTDGNDVTGLTTLLSDLNAKITDANTQVAAVQTELTPLTAAGYPGNKTTLVDARTKIKAAAQDLKTAYQDILQIRNLLKGLKVNPEASSSAH